MPEIVLFNRYHLLESIASGGSAQVWRAFDDAAAEEVAVKRLHPVVFADEAARRRLRREFAALRRLDHPNIVRVRDLAIGEREAVLVLDYIAGPSVAQRLHVARATGTGIGSSGPTPAFPPEEVARVVGDVAAALVAAHAAGIVHRDVTPGNILLAPDGSARLTDFGIAGGSVDAGDTTAITATGLVLGTLRYLAPEQLHGRPATAASDLYGLAAVAYEMISGRPPYLGSTPVELVEAHQVGPPPIENVPAELDAAIRARLVPDPGERGSDVRGFAASVSAGLPTLRTPVTAALPVAPAPPAPSSLRLTRRSPERSRPGRGIPGPVAALVGLLLAAVLLAAAATTSRPLFGSGAPSAPSSGQRAATPRLSVEGTLPSAGSAHVTAVPGAAGGAGDGKAKGHDKGKGHGKDD